MTVLYSLYFSDIAATLCTEFLPYIACMHVHHRGNMTCFCRKLFFADRLYQSATITSGENTKNREKKVDNEKL